MNNIYILILRELKIKYHWRPLLASQLFLPLVYLFFFGISFSATLKEFQYAQKLILYFDFLLPGIIILQTFTIMPLIGTLTSNDVRLGIYKMIKYYNVTPMQYIFSKSLCDIPLLIAQTLLMLFVSLIFSVSLYSYYSIDRILLVIVVVIISTFTWANLGITLGLLLPDEQKRSLLFTLINFPLMFSSPIFYPLKDTPLWIQTIAHINPMTYSINFLRDLMFSGFNAKNFTIIIILALLSIAVSSITAQQRRL